MQKKQPEPTPPKVYLIDDDPIATFLLTDLVESVDLPYVVFESAVQFLKQDNLGDLQGCIVCDLRMPGLSGLELQDELHKQGINLPMIFISAYAEVQTVVRAMRGGALDFFQKPYPSQQMIERIQDGIRTDQERATLQARNRDIGERMALLTPREKEVLQGIFEGKLSKVIAEELGISTRTAETYRQLIMQKLQAGSIAELVRLVVEGMSGKPPASS